MKITGLQKVFCDNLKRLRQVRNLSQGELAKLSDMDQARLSKIENGKVEPGLLTIEKIAKGLNIKAALLLIDENNPITGINTKLIQIELLNPDDQKLVKELIESLLHKAKLEGLQNSKMKNRLEELEQSRSSK